jgi:hypothetical protein
MAAAAIRTKVRFEPIIRLPSEPSPAVAAEGAFSD